MTNLPLTKKTARRLATMVEAGLVDYKQLHSWADWHILQADIAPFWVYDLAVEKHSTEVAGILRLYAFSDPIEQLSPPNPDDEALAALFLRHERGELSWATFLSEAGQSSDASTARTSCEFFYRLLDELDGTESSESTQRRQISLVLGQIGEDVAVLRPLYEELISYSKDGAAPGHAGRRSHSLRRIGA